MFTLVPPGLVISFFCPSVCVMDDTRQIVGQGRDWSPTVSSQGCAAREGNKKNNKCDKMQNENSIGGRRRGSGTGAGEHVDRRSLTAIYFLNLSTPTTLRMTGEVQGVLVIDDGCAVQLIITPGLPVRERQPRTVRQYPSACLTVTHT